MVALIPPLEDTQAYLRPQGSSSSEDFARLLENVGRRAGAAAPPAPPRYTVQAGDNLWEVARKMGQADPYALARANGIKNPDLLRVGQVLKLTDPPQSQPTSSATALASGKPPARVRGAASAGSLEQPVVNGAGPMLLPARQAVQTVAAKGREQVVVASWYGPQHHGRLMANGKPFNMHADTVAHPSLPLGTRLRLTNPDNGSSVEVKVTDRGPYIRGRNLDLSYGVAKKLGVVKSGVSRLLMQKS
jgi:hypothetical protein